ncbi:methylmalonyl-CoA mutase family protein, partial [Bacillus subtilis]
QKQIAFVKQVRRERDNAVCEAALAHVRAVAADETASVMPALIEAARARATLGEMVLAIQDVLGGYQRETVLAR